jgi:transmembrane sensor
MSIEPEDTDMIEEVAADWLAEREEGLSPARVREFERWCRQDSRHAAAVAHLEQACALLQQMPQVRAELQPVVEFPAAGRMAAQPSGESRRNPEWRIGLGLTAVVVLAALSWWQWPRAGPEPVRYATSAGGYERVLLADGSTLELNANSEARVELSLRERRVVLRAGEAHFSVARDLARPFVVEAAGVAVRAVGTAFNVRIARAAVEVLVTEGRVAVAFAETGAQQAGFRPNGAGPEIAAPPTELGANERLLMSVRPPAAAPGTATPPVIEKIGHATLREVLAWQERKLVFAETPLREVVTQFNQRNRLQLVVDDPVLAERPVGGTFAADNIEGFVRLLAGSGTVAVERRSEFEIVLRQVR